MSHWFAKLVAAMLVFAVALPVWTQNDPPTLSKERLDRLLAPVALYPDSLLTQVLMAATYPAQVGEAVSWSASLSKGANEVGHATHTVAA